MSAVRHLMQFIKMKVLVLGGNGMLGHKMTEILSESFDVWALTRSISNGLVDAGIVSKDRLITGVDVLDFDLVENRVKQLKPDWIINCIGMIKHREESKDSLLSIELNAALPHRLAHLARVYSSKLITFSTDCVYRGDRGNYSEDDLSDAVDLYGKTKALGEVNDGLSLTLRSSIIGRELSGNKSLVEWVLSERGNRVNGFTKAIYSGLTTIEMARLVEKLIRERRDMTGLYHVSSDPIDKFKLVSMINKEFGLGMTIDRDEQFEIDRSLNSQKFRKEASFQPKGWKQMIKELAADSKQYDAWRKLTF